MRGLCSGIAGNENGICHPWIITTSITECIQKTDTFEILLGKTDHVQYDTFCCRLYSEVPILLSLMKSCKIHKEYSLAQSRSHWLNLGVVATGTDI